MGSSVLSASVLQDFAPPCTVWRPSSHNLRGAPRGAVAHLIELSNQYARRVIALDIPSGVDATSGATPGVAVRPECTLTLALPKVGLEGIPGEVYLADIGIPREVFARLGVAVPPMFGGHTRSG